MTEETSKPTAILPQNADDWKRLLETAFPSGKHVIHDIAGNEYTVNTILSARRETELLRVLTKAADLPVGDWSKDLRTGGAPAETIQGLVNLLSRMSGDPRVLNLLDEAFCLVHRPVVDRALAACVDHVEGLDNPSAVDVFDLMEMVSALLPFVAKAIRKVMEVLKKLPSQTPSLLPN